MSKMPYVFSIVTVVKNNAQGLRRTLQSVLSQSISRKLYQIVVVDGESSDNVSGFIEQFSPNIFISQSDSGIYDAMNTGIKHCLGEWIYFLNTDDFFASNTVLEKIQNQCIKTIDEQQKIQNNAPTILCAPVLDLYRGHSIIRKTKSIKKMPLSMPAGHQGIMVENQTIKKNMFDPSYKICGDAELIARLVQQGHNFFFTDIVMAKISGEGYSNKHWKMYLQELSRIQKQHYPSIYLMLRLSLFSTTVYIKKIIKTFIPKRLYLYIRKIIHKKS